MNCKPGDLAVIVKSAAGNEGRIVHVVDKARYGYGIDAYGDMPIWWVRSAGTPMPGTVFSASEFNFPDAWLRPIRPPSQEDETETVKEMESV